MEANAQTSPAPDGERALSGRFPRGEEVFSGLGRALSRWKAAGAWISLWGSLSSAVLAVLDPVQGVYATRREEGPWEIGSCTGLWIPRAGETAGICLWAVLAGPGGRMAAGRLFPDVPAVSAAFLAREAPIPPDGEGEDPWLWPPLAGQGF